MCIGKYSKGRNLSLKFLPLLYLYIQYIMLCPDAELVLQAVEIADYMLYVATDFLVGYLCVNLGGCDILMPHHLGQGFNCAAIAEYDGGGECMAGKVNNLP